MPAIVLKSCDATQPTINPSGYGTFSLIVTLSATPIPGSPVQVDVVCTPSSDVTLNSPYYFIQAQQIIDVVTTNVVTSMISPIIEVSCGNVNICMQVFICPTGTRCPSTLYLECTGP